MNSVTALLAALSLTLPAATDAVRAPAPEDGAVRAAPPGDGGAGKLPRLGFRPAVPAGFGMIERAHRPPPERQVRIEQRVIIRIAPGGPPQERQRFEEQPLDGCVPIDTIAAVQPTSGNRLLLFLRDSRILSAALERSCNAQDFYSGFYLERQADGALCSRRDRLQSRAGASCRVTELHRLVRVVE